MCTMNGCTLTSRHAGCHNLWICCVGNVQLLRGYLSKASVELSEAPDESKDIGRIVKGHWQNWQSSCKSSKVAHRGCAHMYSIYVCSKITQTDIRTHNLKAVKNYSVPQERKRDSTKVVQYYHR